MFLITRRRKRWVVNCRRDDLMKKDASYLYNPCRMCDEHFDASQFMDPANKLSLVWDAIPTIFPVRNPQHLLTPKRKAPTHRAPPILARAICGGNYTLSTTNKRHQAWYCPQKNG